MAMPTRADHLAGDVDFHDFVPQSVAVTTTQGDELLTCAVWYLTASLGIAGENLLKLRSAGTVLGALANRQISGAGAPGPRALKTQAAEAEW